MQKLNKRFQSLGFLGVFIFVIFCSSFFAFVAEANEPNEEGETYIDINEDTTWHSADDLSLSKIVYVNRGATLFIEKGARVKFGKDINGDDTYLSVSGGRLVADGTQEEPISITSDSDQQSSLIEFSADYWDGVPAALPSFLRYVEFSGGGYEWDTDCPDCSAFWSNFISPAYAEIKGSPAIFYLGGKVHFENCKFHDNDYADVEIEYNEFDSSTGTDNYLEIVNSNFEKNGDSMAARSKLWCKDAGYGCISKMLFKNNWYGSASGPYNKETNDSSNGKEILGDVLIDGWRANNMIADPVIVIPGILGSAPENYLGGDLVLDPILHTYDNLIASFEMNGYAENENLFQFPYEWRNSNIFTADLLRQKIQTVTTDTRISKVDLAAHSMGGLVARYYIESPLYNNDVDQLITLGTPHHGAPESYLSWEAGEFGVKFEDKIIKKIFQLEALHSTGSPNLKEYLQAQVKSVGQLLPDQDYLYDLEKGEMRHYSGNYLQDSDNYPQNTFLDFLNSHDGLENLKKVNFYNIYGDTGKSETISEFNVVTSEREGLWENGMPKNFYDDSTNQGIEYDIGDGTVPLESSKADFYNEKQNVDSAHTDLPTEAQCYVIQALTGKSNCEPVDTFKRIKHILTFGVFSPVDIQVIAPDGKSWAGKNINNLLDGDKIAGAYYTGYEGVMNEFITIPDREDGEYTIITEGTGNGPYTVRVAKISEDAINPEQAVESEKYIAGTAVLGLPDEKFVQVLGNKVLTEAEDTTRPEIAATVSPEPNENGWNNTDVAIHFEATDGGSGMDENKSSHDIILGGEGANQSASWTTADKAENSATKNITGINIDKTAPTTEAILSGTTGNSGWFASDVAINFSSNDILSGVKKTYYDLDEQGFQEGDNLSVTNEGLHSLRYYSEDLAGNSETIKQANFKLDKTAPTIKIISPEENKTYLNNNTLKIEYTVNDFMSPADKINKIITYDNQKINADKIDLALEHPANYSLIISAEDEAGNINQTQVNFTISADVDSIISNVEHYFRNGFITDWKTAIYLEVKLRNIKAEMQLLDVFENKRMPKWAKEKVIENLKKEINGQIEDLITKLGKDKKFLKNIDSNAAEILKESLIAIRY